MNIGTVEKKWFLSRSLSPPTQVAAAATSWRTNAGETSSAGSVAGRASQEIWNSPEEKTNKLTRFNDATNILVIQGTAILKLNDCFGSSQTKATLRGFGIARPLMRWHEFKFKSNFSGNTSFFLLPIKSEPPNMSNVSFRRFLSNFCPKVRFEPKKCSTWKLTPRFWPR